MREDRRAARRAAGLPPLDLVDIFDCCRNKQKAVNVKVDSSSPKPRPINKIAADLKKELYKRLKAEEEVYFLNAELLQAIMDSMDVEGNENYV